MYTSSVLILLASAGLLEARSVLDTRHHHGIHRRADSLTLLDSVIQQGSENDGTNEIGFNDAEAKSLTSTNNFINFCAGKTLSNGLQITTGSCNGIPMGDLPGKTAMVSSIITSPLVADGSKLQSDTTFSITVQMSNLVAGSFTNADATYFSAPQQLSGGKVIGHTHVTVQDLGKTMNPTVALDATQFAFFKGINDAGNGNGLLTAVVTGGLPAGNYRVCTLASASNHQPVVMPVAQRGTADDCTKFVVNDSGKNVANAASNNGSGGIAAAAAAASAVANGAGKPDPNLSAGSSASSSTSSTSIAKGNNKATTASVESSTSTLVTKAGKGGKAVTSAPFSNSTIAVKNTKTKDVVTTTSISSTTTSSSSSVLTTASATKAVVTKAGKGGNGKAVGTASSTTTIIVKKVVVIKTFFEFVLSLGGLPPSISKNKNNKFVVLNIEFDDITTACGSACDEQLTTCVSFSGPGFKAEECTTQHEKCKSAASAQTSASSAAQITATATLPPTATVTGSVISVETVTTTVLASTEALITATTALASAVTQVAVANNDNDTGAKAVDVLTGSSASTCALVTSTIWVDAPSSTITAAAAVLSTSSSLPCTTVVATVTTTQSADLAINTAALVVSSTALGGIAAPAITDSGDATRPFLVNGNTFVNKAAAVQRSCDVQLNQCANAFNGGKAAGAFDLSDCNAQEDACVTAGAA